MHWLSRSRHKAELYSNCIAQPMSRRSQYVANVVAHIDVDCLVGVRHR